MQKVDIVQPKHIYTLLCDDIRQEFCGKTSLMGLYDHYIIVPQIPYILPKICFHTRFSGIDGKFNFSFSLVAPDYKRNNIIINSPIELPNNAFEGTVNVVVSPFNAKLEGTYEVIMSLVKDMKCFEYIYKFAVSSNERVQYGNKN